MKKGLLMVVILLAMASLMATMAYSSAMITNVAHLKVVTTDKALLALENKAPWGNDRKTTGSKDNTVTIDEGELVFKFGNGVGSSGGEEFHGLQPNSVYTWNYLFTVKNKSAEDIDVTVYLEGDLANYITLGTTDGNGSGASWGSKGSKLVLNNIQPGDNRSSGNIKNIALKIELPPEFKVPEKVLLGKLIVSAEAK